MTARIAEMLRGLAALVTLVLIVVGTPWLLLTLAPLPAPAGLPALNEITTTLTSRDDGTIFLRAVALIAWGAWAVFALGVLVESAAQLGGRQAPRLPGMGSLQRTAARLVAAVLVALGVGTPAAMAAAPPAAVTHATPHTPPVETPTAQPGRDPAAGPPKAEGHTRIVDRGDTLWSIAENEYGKGERYRVIFRASEDIDQPGGIPRLADPDLIYPGERLFIPKAGDPADPAPPSNKPQKPHVEHPSAPPTAESPSATPSPGHGAARPPSTAAPSTPSPSHTATGSPAPERGAGQPPPTARVTPPGPPARPTGPSSAAPAPSTSTSAGAGMAGGPTASSPSLEPSGPGTAPNASTSHVPDGGAADENEPSPVSARTILGYSALAAAGLLALLALKRLVQQRRRRPGQRIRVPETMSDSEMDMRSQQEPASVELLDTALRSLSFQLGRTGGTLPSLRGAHVTGETVELLLTEPAEPAPPFTFGPTPTRWRLDPQSGALLDPDDFQDVPSPYPALVTLGFDKAFNHVLIDLETAGAITLTGGGGHVQEVLAALALEMAISPWADHIMITCVAFGKELPRVVGTGRLRHAASVDEALRDFEARAREVSEVLADAHIDSVRQARTDQVADDAWTPQVILSSTPFSADEVGRLGSLIGQDGATNLAAVIAAGGPGRRLPGRWELDTTPGRTVEIEPFGPVTVQRIVPDQYDQLISDLSIANDECGVPHPDWQDVPPEPETIPGDVRIVGRPLGPEQPDETLIDQAARIIGESPTGDASLLQRRLSISYEQASRLIKRLTAQSRPEADGHARNADAADLLLDPNAPEIRVLGRVEIGRRDVGDIEPGKRNLLPELAAYLHLNPGRTADEVSRALGGSRGPWSPSTRASNMSRLRAWFGRDGQGNVYVPTQGQGRLYTVTGVRCDWDRFQILAQRGLARLKRAENEHAIAELRAALALVRGQPFAGAGPTSYIWAEHLKQEMISAIVDVVHALGITLIEMGDAPGARAVITRGLDIEPGSELLFRDLIRAEHRAGNSAGIDHATERLLQNLHELGLEMEPETADLLARLRPTHPRATPA